ncbi:MAG: hypothetical protein UT08_C0009G0020 [Candidatus Woesebacteria bacterium GW2011_GWB1_38_8]|uniref:Uncharacterized protein n=1 Tax=Candidatus Woesebacteria bacterium GW2011_GWB1_38_8 TaxID=1618570 RepID=A0A0G0P7C4_9BACT|nr:MAG: hypothetical protein UT08_C0009G0020 [Candidatus Woesebacteria bacterium GW2011_GWB1_38_8]
MKRPPTGAVFEMKQMKQVDFYRDALVRLNDEVGTILQLVEEHNKKSERKIGFWASLRMILPVVEAVSNVAGETPQEFLGKHLDVKTPHLAWDLFRHSLIHGDYLQHGKYQSKEVGWGVIMMGQGHINASGHIGIDVISLYEKLREFLEDEVAKNDQTSIEIEVGVLYTTPKIQIIDDFSKL